jgi:hypothetical protein
LVLARGPLRRVLAALAGRFVAARGWERLGFARSGDWARERLGLSARSLQDLARVDAQLARLPAVEAALVAGALSWTKVRLVARVATPEDEARWLALARRVASERLARAVRAVDVGALEAGVAGPAGALGAGAAALAPARDETDEDGAPEAERACLEIRCDPAVRARWWTARQLARRQAGEPLPPWAAMEWVAAEVLSAFPLEVEPGPACAAEERDPAACRSAPAAAVSPAPCPEPVGAPADRCGETTEHTAASAAEAAPSARTSPRSPHGAADPCAGQRPVDEHPFAPRTSAAPGAAPIELPPALRALVEGLAEADAFELEARLRRAVAQEQRLEAELGEHLLRVAEGRLHFAAGLRSLEHYARERLGISPRRARAILRLARTQRRWPALHAAWASGRLSAAKARALIPLLAGAEPAEVLRWIEHAERATLRRLEDDLERREIGAHAAAAPTTDAVAAAPAGRHGRAQPSDSGAKEGLRDPRGESGAGEEVAVAAEPEPCRVLWWGPADAIALFRATLATVRRRIERAAGHLPSEGEALGAMLEHAIRAWGGDVERLERRWRIFARDGWRCAVPGCSSHRNLHAHHLEFRAAGGSDAVANLVTLCAWHHLRGVHAGRLRIRGRAPRRLRFELGLRPGRPPLLAYGSGDALGAGAPESRP